MAKVTRREAIGAIGAATVGVRVAAGGLVPLEAATLPAGQLVQSVCRWCYQDIPLADFFRQVGSLGLTAVDLLERDEWVIASDYGLSCSTGYGGGGTVKHGINDRSNHDEIVSNLEESLPRAARAGVSQIIVFVGNRRGMSDVQGIDNCTAALQRIVPAAESEGVTVLVELLNSRVNYPDYHGDRTAFGIEIIKRVGSPRVKLLYDIYHMQVMEGDIIRTIRENSEYIGHYHTGGVPGRRELGSDQELNWPVVCRAIAETGYQGYIAHEFVPTREPMMSLGEAVRLCTV
jgi:hydroxypyruvate isomerase